jgi:hypothetical protein
MGTDRTQAIEALLVEAERAHAVYEAADLGGTYDESWPQWYAGYAVEHGIGDLIGQEVGADALAGMLVSAWDAFQAERPDAAISWSAFAASRLAQGS